LAIPTQTHLLFGNSLKAKKQKSLPQPAKLVFAKIISNYSQFFLAWRLANSKNDLS
jgi:hypothetical protein